MGTCRPWRVVDSHRWTRWTNYLIQLEQHHMVTPSLSNKRSFPPTCNYLGSAEHDVDAVYKLGFYQHLCRRVFLFACFLEGRSRFFSKGNFTPPPSTPKQNFSRDIYLPPPLCTHIAASDVKLARHLGLFSAR